MSQVRRIVVTVLNSLEFTTIEFTKFVMYRCKHFKCEHHVIFVLATVSADVKLHYAEFLQTHQVTLIDCGGSYHTLVRKLHGCLRVQRAKNIATLLHINHGWVGLWAQLVRYFISPPVPVHFGVRSSFSSYRIHSKILSLANICMANRVSFVGRAAYEAFPPHFGKWVQKKCTIIANGIDDASFETVRQSAKAGLRHKGRSFTCDRMPIPFRLMAVGRLVVAKHHGWLLHLMTHLSEDVELTIIGSGVLHETLRQHIADLHLERRVVLAGRLPIDEVIRQLLFEADAFVSASIREGMPNAVLEAMAAGLPVILSNIRPHDELAAFSPGVKTLPFDVDLWRSHILHLRQINPQARKTLEESNMRAIQQHFTLDNMHEKYTVEYDLLTGEV